MLIMRNHHDMIMKLCHLPGSSPRTGAANRLLAWNGKRAQHADWHGQKVPWHMEKVTKALTAPQTSWFNLVLLK